MVDGCIRRLDGMRPGEKHRALLVQRLSIALDQRAGPMLPLSPTFDAFLGRYKPRDVAAHFKLGAGLRLLRLNQ